MSDFEIRRIRPGDGPALARNWRETGALFMSQHPDQYQVPAPAGLDEWFEEIIALRRADPAREDFVAQAGDTIVGKVSMTLHEPVEHAGRQLMKDIGRRRLHIDALSVVASQRRSGVGAALMRAAEEWGREQGAGIALLETQADNPMSIPFYERAGYRVEEVIFRKELDPAAD